MFDIGEKVSYPMHGVGIIEAIQEQEVLGEKARYYMVRFVIGRMTAMVPVNSAEAVGMRKLISADECEKVQEYLVEDCAPEIENWSQRYRDNLEKLRTGEIYGVADVVKSLIRRDKEKGLSAGERKMFITAKQVLVAEMVAASGEEEKIKAIMGD